MAQAISPPTILKPIDKYSFFYGETYLAEERDTNNSSIVETNLITIQRGGKE
jgi:hypothetical protein